MADILQGLRAWWPHDGFRRWGSANKQVFVYQSWPSVCQKSIYLPEQGGRSRPGLKKWVSGRLSPSALSQLGMRVLHHPTWSVTSARRMRRGEKEEWGVVHPSQCFSGWLWLHLTHQQHMSRGSNAGAAPDQGHYSSQHYTFWVSVKLTMRSSFIFLRVKLLWSFIVCSSIKRLRLSLLQQTGINTSPFVCIAFILIRDGGVCEMHMHFNLI